MSDRKVLDTPYSDADVDNVMHGIIAQNPQLNSQIEEVRNSNNAFLCEVIRIYPYEDKAYVKILDDNKYVYCRLSHEILGNGMSIDYLPVGNEQVDKTDYVGKTFVRPYASLYAVMMKVRWENLNDEYVLLGYVNIHDRVNLKSSNDTGEISLKSGSSIISVDDERINIRCPELFINGLPFTAPELENYYNKKESDIITNTLNSRIDNISNTDNECCESNFNYDELAEAIDNYKQKSSSKYTLFRGDCWTINSNFEASASITSTSNSNFKVVGTFRTDSDLVGIYWNSEDLIKHPYISYGAKYDYTDVVLEFDYEMEGCRAWTDNYNDTTHPCAIALNMKDSSIYYIAMYPLITGNHFKMEFNKLKLPPQSAYINKNGNSVTVEEETPVPVNNIESIMLVLKPPIDNGNYNIIQNQDFECTVTNITVTKGNICNEHIDLAPHKFRLCEGYDDFYDLNPYRVCKEMRKLGYTEWCDLYVGASHFYEKSGTVGEQVDTSAFNHTRTEKMVLDTTKPLNKAFREWLNCYSRELKNNDTKNFIVSVSMENLQCPPSWRQKQYAPSNTNEAKENNPNGYALTGWIPSTFFYSPCNTEAIEYMKKVSKACLDIVVNNGLQPILQLGEAWWWWNENYKPTDSEGNRLDKEYWQPPCFYDEATKNKYEKEFGKPLPVFKKPTASYNKKDIQWLNKQVVNYSKELRKVVKKYKNGLYMALFFPPSVLDKDRVPKMMQEVNYFTDIYSPKHLDVIQLEDYDWVIEDSKYHDDIYSLGQKLGFSKDKIHYYGGFVQHEKDATKLWKLIKKAMNKGLKKGLGEVYVWAGTQIRRDKKVIGHDEYEVVQRLLEK